MIDTTFRSHGECQTLKAGIMVKVVRYCRVSTEEQSETGHAMAAQREKLKAYAALDDLELIEITEDGGQSVKTLNRPHLQRALQLLRNGEADGPPDAKMLPERSRRRRHQGHTRRRWIESAEAAARVSARADFFGSDMRFQNQMR